MKLLTCVSTEGLSTPESFSFFHDMATISDVPEYSGYNTRKCKENGQGKEPSTTVLYIPLINRKPADPTTMLSAMLEAQKFTSETGQIITIFTADQQLYKVMIDIVWVYPELFINFVSRLGGMHWLPSYVGCIGRHTDGEFGYRRDFEVQICWSGKDAFWKKTFHLISVLYGCLLRKS